NGAGKSTAFQCISGVLRADAGRVRFDGAEITGWQPGRITRRGLVRSFQIARGIPRLTARENLLLYGPAQPGERLLAALLRRPAGAGSLYGASRGVTALLSIEGLVGGYGASDEVLKGIGFELAERHMAAVVGPNGAGKSTLLKAIAGLIRPKAGRIALDGQSL